MSTALLVWLVSVTTPAGQVDDPYVGNVMCVRCHEEEQAALIAIPHGDSESAVEIVDNGCQSCHGPGRAHVQRPENEDRWPNTTRMTIAEKNALCQSCHTDFPPFDANHSLETYSCSTCHLLHQQDQDPDAGILAWQVYCLDCHTGDETDYDELHAYDAGNMASGLVSCQSCHQQPPHEPNTQQ